MKDYGFRKNVFIMHIGFLYLKGLETVSAQVAAELC